MTATWNEYEYELDLITKGETNEPHIPNIVYSNFDKRRILITVPSTVYRYRISER
jgi:hypothetical protein